MTPNDCSTDSSCTTSGGNSSSNSSTCDDDHRCCRRRGAYNETKKSTAIITRPHASHGYWLCCLLPLALVASYLQHQRQSNGSRARCSNFQLPAYQWLTVAALGMCIESMCFFMYMFLETGLLLKLLISLVPGLLTSCMCGLLLQQSLAVSLFSGFAITFFYQNAYIRVLRGMPQTFTYGEACVIVQGVMLFFMNCLLQLPQLMWSSKQATASEFVQFNVIMMFALFCLLLTCFLLVCCKTLRRIYCFYPLMAVLLLVVTLMPVTQPLPIVKIFEYILSNQRRIYVILFYLVLVLATICTVAWQLRHSQKASTRVRKIFHVLVVLVYVPGLLYQCTLLYIASGVALALFTVLELFRILQMPPLGGVLKSSFASFGDDKDAGAIALTPFCLLIGISLPMWLSPCPCHQQLDTAAGGNLLSLMAGILTIGFGDTAASVYGSLYGHLKWKNSSRSLEGTMAFIVVVSVAVYVLFALDFTSMNNTKWFITAAAIVASALVEALTDQIDNLVLPLVFYIIVSFA